VSSRQRAARGSPAWIRRQQGVIAEGFVSTQRQHGLIHSGAIPFAVLAIFTPLLKSHRSPDRRRAIGWRKARLGWKGKQRQPAQTSFAALSTIAVGVMGAAAVNQGGRQDPGGNAQLLRRSPEAGSGSEPDAPQLLDRSGWRRKRFGDHARRRASHHSPQLCECFRLVGGPSQPGRAPSSQMGAKPIQIWGPRGQGSGGGLQGPCPEKIAEIAVVPAQPGHTWWAGVAQAPTQGGARLQQL